MILVTVGTNSWNFERLIKEMDSIAVKIDEEIIMQISDIAYTPQNAKYFRFTSKEEMERLFMDARIIVSHAGVGCIISALKYNKPLIIVPRRKMYNEHFDDHQVDIAKELERDSRIKVVWDIKKLEEVINSIKSSDYNAENSKELASKLKIYLRELEQQDNLNGKIL